MLLIYYRMYITYTLAGFLFDLDQKSNIAEISKRLNIEYDKSMRTNSAEDISNNQKIKNDRGSRKIFSRLSCFHRLYIEQQIPRPIGNKIKEIFYSGKNALLHDY
jgi:DNA topoisomerase VI subunit A